MSHRLQITLEDEQYQSLMLESDRTGASMAELIRQAIEARLGIESSEQRAARFRRALGVAAGTWHDRAEDGLAYQRRMRAPLASRGRQ
jgi:Ribbon-helix-helix protein, copG family